MLRTATLIVVSLSTVACAGANYRPLVDSSGSPMYRYESDLAECQQYARQVLGSPEQAAAGAVIGAVLGGVLAAAAGSRYDWRATARVGAVAGGVSGAAAGENSQRDIIRNCMAGRGFRVLQ